MTDHDPFGLRSLTVDQLRSTPGVKWQQHPDRLAAWVADMDFRSPQPIVDALVERAQHGVFGYTDPPPQLEALLLWRHIIGLFLLLVRCQ